MAMRSTLPILERRPFGATQRRDLWWLPNVPTVAETIPGFAVGAWAVLVAPLGTPDGIIRKVNADLNKAVDDPELRAKFAANGAFVRHMTPEEVTSFVQIEQATWRPILEAIAREVPK